MTDAIVALTESPHDKLFKDAFGSPEAARGMIQALVPASIVDNLDLNSLVAVPGTFIDEALTGSQSDLLFSSSLCSVSWNSSRKSTRSVRFSLNVRAICA